MVKPVILCGLFLGTCLAIGSAYWEQSGVQMIPITIESVHEVEQLFKSDVQTIKIRALQAIERSKKELEEILSVHKERNFDNTIRALDTLGNQLQKVTSYLHVLEMVSPDQSVRQAAHEEIQKLEAYSIDYLDLNPKLYQACLAYYEGNYKQEQLTEAQNYYVQELMKSFKRSGLHLPQTTQDKIKLLKKQLVTLALEFETAINADHRTMVVSIDELQGLTQDFIAQLARSGQGYVLGVDYPTYYQVMEHCTVAATRQALWTLFHNRAHPDNSARLSQVIALRHELAQLLGYESYGALVIENSMAKSVSRVEEFLNDLQERVAPKVNLEMVELQADLPAGVQLTQAGQLQPWDLAYVKAYYKKKHLQIDEQEIAHYFPLDHTLKELLAIYEKFFALEFTQVESQKLWHPEVRLLEVRKQGTLIGHLLLDLHPRLHKYTHACEISVVKGRQLTDGTQEPAVAVVLANFPKPTAHRPALLQRNDVNTFFHEFGHALHELLGSQDLYGQSGTAVKIDFVEMPSQMLEEWLWNGDILRKVSSHVTTGKPLPQALIDRIQAIKQFDTGDFIQRQIMLARYSLACFDANPKKDTHALWLSLEKSLRPYVVSVDDNHFEASFGHLMGYSAQYYSYLWSKVFALDLFETIKQFGLLNPEIGLRYTHQVIGCGGSADPEQLLENFLGRAPTSDAFFKDLGLVRQGTLISEQQLCN